MKILSIETPTHGRVLCRERPGARIVLVGFHGYTENADIQMERLEEIRGGAEWTLIAVQGLHRFYRGKTPDISASWMTRQDRDEMIADNIEYGDRVLEALTSPGQTIVTLGFSQGVAMAFRTALCGRRRAHGVVAVGGDIPPELLTQSGIEFPPVLLARGETDDWYTASKLEHDVKALANIGNTARVSVYPGGHQWTEQIAKRAAGFIEGTFGKD